MTEWDEDRHGYLHREMQVTGDQLLLLTKMGVSLLSDETAEMVTPPHHRPVASLTMLGVSAAHRNGGEHMVVTAAPLMTLAVLVAQIDELVRTQPPPFQTAFQALRDQEVMRLRESLREMGGGNA